MRDSEQQDQQKTPVSQGLYLDALSAAIYQGGVAAMMQSDPKTQGKEKKPDIHPVSLVVPGK